MTVAGGGAGAPTAGEPQWYGYPPRPWPPAGWPERSRTYQRTLRVRSYRWWKPLLGILVLVGSYVALLFVLVVVPGVVAVSVGVDQKTLDDQGSPLIFLLGNVSLAALIPCAMLALWAVHRIRPGFLSSVAGRLRWRWLLTCGVIAFGVVLVGLVASFLLPVGQDDGSTQAGLAPIGTFVALAAVILVTTPLQAAGEEYAFRGYLTQAIGAWVRFPIVPILVTSVLFALAHGTQNAPLFLDRFTFGLVAGYLVWRTGGLEASIALHTMNNIVVLMLGALYTDFGDQLTSTGAPWGVLVFDGVQLVLYVALIEWVRRSWVRRGRLRIVTDEAPHGGAGVLTSGL